MSLATKITSEYLYLTGFLRALRRATSLARRPHFTFADFIDKVAERYPQRIALIDDHNEFSYREYNEKANQYARWALANNLQKGDCVALLMPNRAEYLVIWLGLVRVGVAVALVNTSTKANSLAHSINIVEPKHIICDESLVANLDSAHQYLNGKPRIWLYGSGKQCQLPQQLPANGQKLNEEEKPKLKHSDHALYIYTSGTTDMPKAANINHYRLQAAANAFSAAANASMRDRMYICLPLYHISGGILASGTVLTVGGCVIIAEKFSASHFWQNITVSKATMFQYIGEMCRYLLQAPPSEYEHKHNLRLCCGNGLQLSVWHKFKRRFNIPKIFEWYAATEGNCVLFNFDSKPGALGRIPWYLRQRINTELLAIDQETYKPVRKNGLCLKVKPGQIGEAIAEITDNPQKPGQRFEGYLNKNDSNKKILNDVFKPGDAWFRSGDLMRQDKQGYYYFIDRVNGSFRWKGENVSSQQVANIIAQFPGVTSSCVYGVPVPNCEGKAGMAAIVVDHHFDLNLLPAFVKDKLPFYARPLFIRLAKSLPLTSTMKIMAYNLQKSGFNPDLINEPLYFYAAEADKFVTIDPQLFERINSGQVRI